MLIIQVKKGGLIQSQKMEWQREDCVKIMPFWSGREEDSRRFFCAQFIR